MEEALHKRARWGVPQALREWEENRIEAKRCVEWELRVVGPRARSCRLGEVFFASADAAGEPCRVSMATTYGPSQQRPIIRRSVFW